MRTKFWWRYTFPSCFQMESTLLVLVAWLAGQTHCAEWCLRSYLVDTWADIHLVIFTSTSVFFCFLPPPRKVVVEGSRVTSALWGPFDQFLITGHEDGTLAQYDILHVSLEHSFMGYQFSTHVIQICPLLATESFFYVHCIMYHFRVTDVCTRCRNTKGWLQTCRPRVIKEWLSQLAKTHLLRYASHVTTGLDHVTSGLGYLPIYMWPVMWFSHVTYS